MEKGLVARRLSKSERRLFYLLPADGNHVTTAQLIIEYYAGASVAANGRVIVMGLVRSVQRKLAVMPDCQFIVRTSQRAGPRPIEVWLEERAAEPEMEQPLQPAA